LGRFNWFLLWLGVFPSLALAYSIGYFGAPSTSWPLIQNFPAGCAAGQAVTQIGVVPTCSAFLSSEVDPTVSGNVTALVLNKSGVGACADGLVVNATTASGVTCTNVTTGGGLVTGYVPALWNQSVGEPAWTGNSTVINNSFMPNTWQRNGTLPTDSVWVLTNNGSDIQNKLNMCSYMGCTVNIPDGNYYIPAKVTYNASNQVIRGQGVSTRIYFNGSAIPVAFGTNDTTIRIAIEMSNLRIESTVKGFGTAIDATNMAVSRFSNIYAFYVNKGIVMNAVGTHHNIIDNFYADVNGSDSFGIFISNLSNDNTILRTRIFGKNESTGILLNATSLSCYDCDVESQDNKTLPQTGIGIRVGSDGSEVSLIRPYLEENHINLQLDNGSSSFTLTGGSIKAAWNFSANIWDLGATSWLYLNPRVQYLPSQILTNVNFTTTGNVTGSRFYGNLDASYVTGAPWLLSYTESDPAWSGNASVINSSFILGSNSSFWAWNTNFSDFQALIANSSSSVTGYVPAAWNISYNFASTTPSVQENLITNFYGLTISPQTGFASSFTMTDYNQHIFGNSSLNVTTNGTRNQFRMNLTNYYNLTNTALRIYLRQDGVNASNEKELWVQLSGDNMDSYYTWKLDTLIRPYESNADWVAWDLPFSSAAITGSPNQSFLNKLQITSTSYNSLINMTTWFGALVYVNQSKKGSFILMEDDCWNVSNSVRVTDAYGYKWVFYCIPSLINTTGYMNRTELNDLQAKGSQIATHNLSSFTGSYQAQKANMIQQLNALKELDFTAGTSDFALPNGVYDRNTTILCRIYYRSCRTIAGDSIRMYSWPQTPADLARLPVFEIKNTTLLSNIQAYLLACKTYGDVCPLLYHKIVPDGTAAVSTEVDQSNFTAVIQYAYSLGLQNVNLNDLFSPNQKAAFVESDPVYSADKAGIQANLTVMNQSEAAFALQYSGFFNSSISTNTTLNINTTANVTAAALTLSGESEIEWPYQALLPKDLGFMAWTYDPNIAINNFMIPANNTIYYTTIYLRKNTTTITNVTVFVNGAVANCTNSSLALYYPNATLMSQTGNTTTNWSTTGLKTTGLNSPITFSGGSVIVGISVACNASTLTNYTRATSAGAQMSNGLTAGITQRCGSSNTVVNNLAPTNLTTRTINANCVWAAIG
jgi:hypothetical protein